MSQLWIVLAQASGTGRQKSFGRSVVFWPCHMVSPTAHLPFSTWHLCFDLAVAHLQGPRGLQTAIRAGWLAFISSRLSVVSLPSSFLSSLLFLLLHLLPLQLSATSLTGTSFVAASSSGWKLRLSQMAGFPRAATTVKSWTSISRQVEQHLPQKPENVSCHITAKQLPCPHPRGSSV